MPRNIGSIDRWLRIIVGIVLLALTMYGPKTAWGYIGLIPLITGVMGYCPLYQAFGWNTRKPHPHLPI